MYVYTIVSNAFPFENCPNEIVCDTNLDKGINEEKAGIFFSVTHFLLWIYIIS